LTAVDISPDLLERAKARPECRSVTFVRTNLEEPLELADDSFDALCGVSVLHHLDTPTALPALLRKLRPGGLFAFSEPNLLNPINKYLAFSPDPARRKRWGTSPGEMAFRPHELRSEMERAGFQVLSLDHRDFLHPSTPPAFIPIVCGIQAVAEGVPLLRMMSGSLWISGRRPA
ncbi:MAG TPA: class I SAM-dependent methyltransferase, partial [Vicinamibacterales bacterium]|nr:class I SAM-dependent methyltransferase [Vicinamibacterales bacterium]